MIKNIFYIAKKVWWLYLLLAIVFILTGCKKQESSLAGYAGEDCSELLIRVSDDKENKDIIIIKPCGWKWGIGELDENNFKIIKVPYLTDLQISEYLKPEYINEETSEVSKNRKYSVDYTIYTEKEYISTEIIEKKDDTDIIKIK